MTVLVIPMNVVAQPSDMAGLNLSKGGTGQITYEIGLYGADCPQSGTYDLLLVAWYPQYRMLIEVRGPLQQISGCARLAQGTADLTYQLPFSYRSYTIYGLLTITYNTWYQQGISISPSGAQQLVVNGWP